MEPSRRPVLFYHRHRPSFFAWMHNLPLGPTSPSYLLGRSELGLSVLRGSISITNHKQFLLLHSSLRHPEVFTATGMMEWAQAAPEGRQSKHYSCNSCHARRAVSIEGIEAYWDVGQISHFITSATAMLSSAHAAWMEGFEVWAKAAATNKRLTHHNMMWYDIP